ncbi:MAG: gluconate 2-dehydrogenase subunit 3 family protein [Pigmentiphaga sp.]|nr:gluconate 2-dehydrogenase subunit 3 family protein [Pigmentiphaga sp.]
MTKTINRRTFVKSLSLSIGSLLLLTTCKYDLRTKWRFFTKEEQSLVDAIVDQIIPADKWMGAKEAGVTNYIDKQLVGPLSRFQESYKKGLAAIKLTCEEIHQIDFCYLERDKQIEFLVNMEKGNFTMLRSLKKQTEEGMIWGNQSTKEFFNLIRDHAMQGYYGSPRHGGNYKYVSYKMIALDFLPVQGQNRYQ